MCNITSYLENHIGMSPVIHKSNDASDQMGSSADSKSVSGPSGGPSDWQPRRPGDERQARQAANPTGSTGQSDEPRCRSQKAAL